MDRELQEYYESSFQMFASKGWSFLIEDLKKVEESLSNIRTVEDAQTLHYRQGQMAILDLLFQRKATCEKVFEELQDEW